MTGFAQPLGPLALSDIARAVAEAGAHSKPQMGFAVYHISDRPGFLFEVLRDESDTKLVRQTLSASANGAGLVVLTEHDVQGSALWPPGAPVVGPAVSDDSAEAKFEGYARPNPSFLYESSSVLEGLIVVEDEPRALSYGHAIALREMAEFLASLAVDEADSPILSFQSPAQSPAHTNDKSEFREREDEWPRSACFSLRFSIALPRGSSAQRFSLMDRIGVKCSQLGYGFWVADTRGGYRQGVWFGVSPHDRLTARRMHPTVADRGGDRKVQSIVPITIVGPARVGSTAAILKYLGQFPELGLAACSITALDDLAFIHVQLAMNYSARRKLAGKNLELKTLMATLAERHGSGQVTPRRFFSEYGPLLTVGGNWAPETPEVAAVLDERCGDYQVLAGPVVEVDSKSPKRLPVWFAWQARGTEVGLSPVLRSLNDVVREVGLVREDRIFLNIEYAVCRASRDGSLHGKAKMSIAESEVPPWASTNGRRNRARALCAELEQRWRAQLLAHSVVAEVSVSDREYRVGLWSKWI